MDRLADKKLVKFLENFNIVFVNGVYVKDYNNGSGFDLSSEALRLISEFYYSLSRDRLKVSGGEYYSLDIIKKCISRIEAILKEICIKDLRHFKDSTKGLWCTDIEPTDTTNFFQL